MIKVKHIPFALAAVLLGAILTTGVWAATETAETEVQFTFNSTLTMSLSSADLLIDGLVPGGVKNSNEIDIQVGTNNLAGYSLSATVGNATYNTRDFMHTNGMAAFNSIDVGSSLAALSTNNTWGYSTNSGTSFSGLPLYSSGSAAELNSSKGAANETTKFLIGAKAGTGQTSGEYNNVINFTAVAKVLPTSLSELTEMQEMTPELCAASLEGETKQLIDTRDGKKYWVAKLRDGNCWMTQNLDLDIPASGLLAANTDITEDWTPSTSGRTAPTATATGNPPTGGNSGYNMTMSYDPGDYVLKNPASWKYTSKTTNLSANTYLQNVSGFTGDYSVGTGTLNSSSTTYSGTSYDTHYHLGNYYQFNAATAGKGASVTSSQGEVADSSICPKGWKLPLSGSNSNAKAGSFYNLLNSYGIASGSSANSLKYVSAPLYLVPGGSVGYNSNGLYFAGYNGNYWSRVSYNSSYAYRLHFSSSYVNPSNYYYRYYAFSVRCVAPGV
ncbi:MAG: hypothetical protein Q4B29_02700 [Candidatus Saccharibacteria bacterium]|nr:hypothetical protein [Candidatus Saccharibacteria bacterium]